MFAPRYFAPRYFAAVYFPSGSDLQLDRVSQAFDPGTVVHMFDLDLTALGGDVYRFTSTAFPGEQIVWRGNVYAPIDVEAEGFEWSGRGPLPTPKIRIVNANMVIGAAALEFGDLIGGTLTRWRTFKQFLDGQPNSDQNAYYPLDIYRIERKSTHNKVYIEWELAAAMDQEGRQLPGGQILRDTCTHRYRVWDPMAGEYDYSKATCPYNDTAKFTIAGSPTIDPTKDVCSKLLNGGCVIRFGSNSLPTRAFPGVAKTRVSQ